MMWRFGDEDSIIAYVWLILQLVYPVESVLFELGVQLLENWASNDITKRRHHRFELTGGDDMMFAKAVVCSPTRTPLRTNQTTEQLRHEAEQSK